MPIYEYKCENCKEMFEVKQSIKDEPIKECPKCKGPVKKVFSKGVSFSFKGKGFYCTDYK